MNCYNTHSTAKTAVLTDRFRSSSFLSTAGSPSLSIVTATMRRQLLLFAVGICCAVDAVKFIDQLSNSAVEVLHGSQRTNTVRQCTCDEMSSCYDSGKREALDCFEPCWQKLDAEGVRVSSNPAGLKGCFDQRRGFIDELVNCFKIKFKACANTIDKAEKVQVKKYDYVEMVNKVEDVIEKQINKFLQSVTSHVVRDLINAGAKLGRCVKECFVSKNTDGFCFDKKGCEPNISDRNAKNAIHQCGKSVNWKREIGELCKCASKTGVSGIADYCGMLNVMG